MLDRLYHRLSARSGFTLVELLVVLIVISVLLGFTTVRVTSAIDSARVASTKAQVRNAFTIAQSNYADNDQSYNATEIEADIDALGGDYVANVLSASAFDETDMATDGQLYLAVSTSKTDVMDAAANPDDTGDYLIMAVTSAENGLVYCYEDNEGDVNSGQLTNADDADDASNDAETCG